LVSGLGALDCFTGSLRDALQRRTAGRPCGSSGASRGTPFLRRSRGALPPPKKTKSKKMQRPPAPQKKTKTTKKTAPSGAAKAAPSAAAAAAAFRCLGWHTGLWAGRGLAQGLVGQLRRG